jgi:hypothetical protein
MTDFETQCDCELDSPGTLSHLPIEERLTQWTDWALYLKRRIETHYRPALSAETKRAEEDAAKLAASRGVLLAMGKAMTAALTVPTQGIGFDTTHTAAREHEAGWIEAAHIPLTVEDTRG